MWLLFTLAIFALIAKYKPTVAVGLILAFLPTYLIRFNFSGYPTTFLELLLLVFITVTFFSNTNRFKELTSIRTLNWLAVCFVGAGVISVLFSPEKEKALGILKAFVIEPVLFFYAVKVVMKKVSDLTTPLNMLFISAVAIALFGIVQYFTLWHLPLRFWGTGVEVERITSVFEYPNALALYLAPLASFFFCMLLSKEKAVNGKNLVIGLVIMAAALLLTFSRGAWLSVGLTIGILLFLRYPWKKVLTGGLVVLGIILIVPATRARLILTLNDPSSQAHTQLMSAALKQIQINPLFGNGLSGFRNTLEKQNFMGEILNYPHNIFLNFWVEMGLLGLISFFGIILVSVNRYKVNKNWYTLSACAFLITLVVHGMVDVPYFKNDLSVLFWFMVSLFYI